MPVCQHFAIITFRNGANCEEGQSTKDLPLRCWHNILVNVSPPDLGRAASVNKTCNSVSNDQRLWLPHFVRDWSPESCVSAKFPCLEYV